ncbi:alpha/beta hydrolase [Streptomyces sp. NPDC091272]|uniref:alpha/beta hydrolase n=1 Tax=Streptomyces sp. NPDC091272 TaxID=3365981 RepID=UPI00380A1735
MTPPPTAPTPDPDTPTTPLRRPETTTPTTEMHLPAPATTPKAPRPRPEGTALEPSPSHTPPAGAGPYRSTPASAAGPLATVPGASRPLVLDAGGVPLSALLAEPAAGPPRATILAVHGRGTGAAYWNSFLPAATALGHTVLAVDRPGYGESAGFLPEGLPLAEQAAALHAALKDYSRTHDTGAGVFLLGHSDGGKVALHTAATEGALPLLGLDTSGTGYRYHPEALHFPTTLGGGATKLNWGPLHLYPPGTFRASRSLLSATPPRESAETVHWPRQFEALAPHVRVPVRLTFAEHEMWWELDEATLAEMTSLLTGSPSAGAVHLPAAGHNIGLGRTAPAYHLAVLTFLEQCLERAKVAAG